MASLAGFTLVWRGTFLDRMWRLNPVAYAQLAPLGASVGYAFILLAAALALAATGWFKRRFWGWLLAVTIISTQLVGDAVNLARGDVLRGATGVVIAGALLLYLLSRKVRSWFQNRPHLTYASG
jgi:hypothetical protein